MLKAYLGNDPGANGAFCALVPELGKMSFIDHKDNSALNIQLWLYTVMHECTIEGAIIEDVHSLHGMSAKTNFSFGGNVREPAIILELTGIPFIKVTPKVWQAGVGVTAKGQAIKQNVADLCKTIYPEVVLTNLLLGKKGALLDGRSDALMIAHYCYLINNPLTLKDK